MEKTSFAIVGCGNIGKRHIAVVDADPNAEVAAICDLDAEKGRQLSNLYGGIPHYTSYADMLGKEKPDVVSICTPHHLHAQMSIQAANHKLNILVEKPMALTTEDCEAMINAAKSNGVKLLVVKQNRYNVPVRLAKEALDKKMLGKIFMVRCDVLWNRYQGYYDDSDWRGRKEKEGGALFTQASHFIDLLVWWFGPVTEAIGHMETQHHNIEIEDCGSAIVKFANGTVGSLNWTTNVYNKNYEGSITIMGENGTIKIGGQYLNKIEYWDVHGFPLQEGVDFTDRPNLYGKYQGTSSNHDKVIKAYIARLRNEKADIVEGEAAMLSVQAIEKIYQSTDNHGK